MSKRICPQQAPSIASRCWDALLNYVGEGRQDLVRSGRKPNTLTELEDISQSSVISNHKCFSFPYKLNSINVFPSLTNEIPQVHSQSPLQSQFYCQLVIGCLGVQTVKLLTQTRDLLCLFQIKIEGKRKP